MMEVENHTGAGCHVHIRHTIPYEIPAGRELVAALELVTQDFCNLFPVEAICLARIYNDRHSLRGYVALEQNALLVKEKSGWMEDNHPLGRLFAYAVYDSMGQEINRWEAYLGAQKCFICGEGAKTCALQRNHSPREYSIALESSLLRRSYGA